MASARKPPKLCLHKPSGNARVFLNGKEHWLGRYGTPECEKRYRELVARWAAGNADSPPPAPVPLNRLTIADVLAQYLIEIRGSDAGEKLEKNARWWLARSMAKELERLSAVRIADVGPKMFSAWVADVAAKPLKRGGKETTRTVTHVRKLIAEFLRMVEWCVAEELLPAEKLVALRSVKRLPLSSARPADTRESVPNEDFNRVLPHLPPAFAAVAKICFHTGMRPSEALAIKPRELDRHSKEGVWIYRPTHHKNQRHGRDRRIHLGPVCQEALAPWLAGKADDDLVFTPESITRVRTPQTIRTRRYRKATLNSRDYARNVRNACRAAGVPKWTPYQVRHSGLQRFRDTGGLDACQQQGGHSKASTTERYARPSAEKAIDTARLIG